MEFKEAVDYRQSIRKFKKQEIANADLIEIVKIAQRAPSWANAQPWKVHIATGETAKQIEKEHLEFSQNGIAGNADFSTIHREQWAPFPRRNMSDWSQQLSAYLASSVGKMNIAQTTLFSAPTLVYLTIDRNSPEWAVFDLGMFAQTLMLAAADKKIDSIAAYEVVKYPDLIRKHMEIPNHEMIAMGIALGYRAEDEVNSFRSARVETSSMLKIKD